MKFTPAAQETFTNLLTANHLDYIHIELEWNEDESCQIHLEAISKDDAKDLRLTTIDNLPIAVSLEDENAMSDISFDAENGEIIIEVPHMHHEGHCCHHHEGGHHCCHDEGEEHDCCCHDEGEEHDCCCHDEGEEHDCCCHHHE